MPAHPALPDPNLQPRRFTRPNWNAIRAIIRREILREILFFKLSLFGPALQAILFAMVFALAVGASVPMIGGLTLMEFLAPGLILSATMHKAFETIGYSFVYDKTENIIGDVFGAPVTSGEVLAGYIGTASVSGLLIGATVWLGLLPFGMMVPVHPLAAAYFALAGVIIVGLLGMLAGIQSDGWDAISAKDVFFITPLSFLSCAFFPLSALNEPFQTLMLYNPLFHLIDGFRYAMTGQTEGQPVVSAIIVFCILCVLTVICHRVLRSGYKIKH